jgi:DNA-binding MarR family transcriptional regulator
MTARSTSINSYHDLQDSPKLGRLQKVVYEVIRTHGPVSNRNIARLAELEINVVTPRVKELRELGLVKEAFTAPDKKTHKQVIHWSMTGIAKDAYEVFSALLVNPPANRGVSYGGEKAVSPSNDRPMVMTLF